MDPMDCDPPSRKRKCPDESLSTCPAKRLRSNSELQSLHLALPTRNASATLDGLPLELKMMIVGYLEEAPTQPTKRVVQPYPRARQYAWMSLSMSSRRDILNLRQQSCGLRDASWKSFGKLLGDLQFRVIPEDIEDLTRISAIPQLAPYITHLAFGTGTFEDWQHGRVVDKNGRGDRSIHSFLKTMATLIPVSIVECIPAFRLLIKKYEVACHGQHYFHNSTYGSTTFANALKALPRLRSLRIDSADWIGEHKTHLRGWLTAPTDRALFDRIWQLTLPQMPKQPKAKPKLSPTHHSIYADLRGQATTATLRITAAIESSGTQLETLTQAWGEDKMTGSPPARAVALLRRFTHPATSLAHLHTLRVQLDYACTAQRTDIDALTELLRASAALKHVDLTFRGPPPRVRRRHPDRLEDVYPLFEGLIETPSGIERLSIRLDGVQSAEYIVMLLTAHSGSLRAVTLDRVELVGEGRWKGVLEELDARCERLEFVGLRAVWEYDVGFLRRFPGELQALEENGCRFRVEWSRFGELQVGALEGAEK
ncbi:hypothetical protein BU16DRAFT_540446 [Lophium mytilinum]|uniref:Uncharacterized protein n=1 Tax=Lophium mytilinum TaxID=390894 RepID=A0A6A6QP38_9PEZI|nr:hypothetical protein BU16DRAFT_540446 [Lophium mytilinum]